MTCDAVPLEPIAAIAEAFRSHPIVALDEDHHNELEHTFLLSLIDDPRFSAAVDDIVVEFGNAKYQPLVDRFINGEDLPVGELRQVWQDTTVPGDTWDVPVYERFYREVRTVNAALPTEARLRVILGDPPIDWTAVNNVDDYNRWGNERDTHAAAVIQREVLDKNRRGLVIYGGLHLQRQNVFPKESDVVDDRLIPALLDAKIFTIWTNTVELSSLQTDVAEWPMPSLALLRGTALGAVDFRFYYPHSIMRIAAEDVASVAVPPEQWGASRMEDQFDAMLYLGSRSGITYARLPRALCADHTYVAKRVRRMSLAGLTASDIDEFKRSCESRVISTA
jgi:hypothetical protein